MADYKQGDIVLAWVRDPEGRRISWPHPSITCVAKCEWKVRIRYEDIEKRLGFTPPDIWDQIVAEILYQQGRNKG